jgi:hypothetical protein
MAFDNARAMQNLEYKIDQAMKKKTLILKEAVKNLSDELVDQTPVYFEELPGSGNMKANWRFGVNGVNTAFDENISDLEGGSTKSALRSDIQSSQVKDNDTLYITNTGNAWKLRSIEFGLYPNPPRLGSWNPVTKAYEIRSEGGFSKQAPGGIVSITALRWSEFVSDAMAKYASR